MHRIFSSLTQLTQSSPTISINTTQVHGIIRRSSSFNTGRIDHIYRDRHETGVKLFLHYGDLCDATNLITIIANVKPDEIYNLGAMSHVKVSFDMPEVSCGWSWKCWGVYNIVYLLLVTHLSLTQRLYTFLFFLTVHRRLRRCRSPPHARRHPCLWARKIMPFLPSLHLRTIRQSSGSSSIGNHSLLPPFSLCCGEAVCILDLSELS